MKRGMKSPEHRAEMDRRTERRAERSGNTTAFAPRTFSRIRETTDVDKVRAAKEKRDRKGMKRLVQRALQLKGTL